MIFVIWFLDESSLLLDALQASEDTQEASLLWKLAHLAEFSLSTHPSFSCHHFSCSQRLGAAGANSSCLGGKVRVIHWIHCKFMTGSPCTLKPTYILESLDGGGNCSIWRKSTAETSDWKKKKKKVEVPKTDILLLGLQGPPKLVSKKLHFVFQWLEMENSVQLNYHCLSCTQVRLITYNYSSCHKCLCKTRLC